MNSLWTQKSENCDPLFYPLTTGTLFAVVAETLEVIEYPSELEISDAKIF